jgi:hypothetical protein
MTNRRKYSRQIAISFVVAVTNSEAQNPTKSIRKSSPLYRKELDD